MFTTGDQKLWTTYCELIGIAYALKIYEHFFLALLTSLIFYMIIVPIKPVLQRNEKFLQIFLLHRCNWPNFKNWKFLIPETKTFLSLITSAATYKKELQVDQIKNKHLPPRIQFATINDNKQLRHLHRLVTVEPIYSSQKKDD